MYHNRCGIRPLIFFALLHHRRPMSYRVQLELYVLVVDQLQLVDYEMVDWEFQVKVRVEVRVDELQEGLQEEAGENLL